MMKNGEDALPGWPPRAQREGTVCSMGEPKQTAGVAEPKQGHRAWSLYLFRVAGIPIYLHFTFLIMLLVIAFMQQGGKPVFEGGLLLVVLIFASVLLHELGHALVAKRYGIKTDDIVLYPIGGVARLRSLGEGFQEFWIAIAGPMVNVVIALVIFIALKATGNWTDLATLAAIESAKEAASATATAAKSVAPGGEMARMWQHLWMINIILIVFNLIPAFPMDGGRILRAILVQKYPKVKATAIAAKIGQGLAIAFMLIGFLNSHIFLMFIGLFVFLAAGQESAATKSAALMTGRTARDAMITHFDILQHGDSLGRAADLLLATSQQEFPVMNGGQVLGLLSRKALVQGLVTHGRDHYVAEVMDREYPKIRIDEDLQRVYEAMVGDRGLPLLVFDHERLVGYINHENLMEYLLIAQARQQQQKNGD